jgi:DNA-binding NtrC family response regulator
MLVPSVLVVDDDYNLRRILEAKLERCPFRVSTVPDLASAILALQTGHYSVIVLDERLPDGSGISVLPQLCGLAPGAIFILMTAYEESSVRQLAEQAGAREILFKPFDLDLLEAVVRTYSAEITTDL